MFVDVSVGVFFCVWMPLIVGCVRNVYQTVLLLLLLLLSVGSLQNGHSEDSLNSLDEHYNSDDQLDIRITDHTLDQVRHIFILCERNLQDSLRTEVVTMLRPNPL